ncbi:MAG: hypothetical protein ACRC33_00045 [Gemmataceae bacterium]
MGVWAVILLTGFWPVAAAWNGARGTTLRHAVGWAAAAWLAWCLTPLWPGAALPAYFAVCLTACAGVAVLGARRPGVGAWDLVVAGLLVVLLRPLLEGVGELRLDAAHVATLAAALAVAAGNYLPTRQGPAAALMGAACAAQLAGWRPHPAWPLAAAWLGWLLSRPRGAGFAAEWRAFRDRYGFAWAARQGEQFNAAAANAGLDARVGWSAQAGGPDGRALALLRATLRRFDADG